MNHNKNTFEIDTLTELASIGAGNSAKSLSVLTGQKINTHVPKVSILKLEQISTHLKCDNQTVSAIVLKINNQLSGTFLMLLTPNQVTKLIPLLNQQQIYFDQINILKELGNILCGTAINSLSEFLKLKLSQSIPAISTDSAFAITDSIVSELGQSDQEILLFETSFNIQSLDLNIYYLFDPKSTETILNHARLK